MHNFVWFVGVGVCVYFPGLSSVLYVCVLSLLGGPAGYGLVQYLGQEVVWRGCGRYEEGSMK